MKATPVSLTKVKVVRDARSEGESEKKFPLLSEESERERVMAESVLPYPGAKVTMAAFTAERPSSPA